METVTNTQPIFKPTIELPDWLKQNVVEKTTEKTNETTTNSLNKEIFSITSQIFDKENKEKTNILSQNIDYEGLKTIFNDLKNVKPDLANLAESFITKQTTIKPTIEMPDWLKPTVVENKTDITTTTTRDKNEIFNNISSIYKPDSLTTLVDNKTKDFYDSLLKTIPKKEDFVVNTIEKPVVSKPKVSTLPPTSTANYSNIVKNENSVSKNETNFKHEVAASIKIDVPNSLELEKYLNNERFISDLTKEIKRTIVNDKILSGAGDYTFNA